MKWITRAHVHVDRVACPWLIRRFVDSQAEFLFAAPSEVSRVAHDSGAIPFDIPGAELGHQEGRCSFESILLRYGLKDPGLQRLAKAVHAADISTERNTDELGPRRCRGASAAGLEAIATGFSLFFPEDPQNLENQFLVYDALYAWCRLQAAAA
jgi:hypothetical protein